MTLLARFCLIIVSLTLISQGEAYSQDSLTSLEELESEEKIESSSSVTSIGEPKKSDAHARWFHTKIFNRYVPLRSRASTAYYFLNKELSTENFKGTKKFRIYCFLKGLHTTSKRKRLYQIPETSRRAFLPLYPEKGR